MGNTEISSKHVAVIIMVLVISLLVNVFFMLRVYYGSDDDHEWELRWSRRAAEEAESVAAISCSGHGRAYLDGILLDGNIQPVCECNTCYGGHDCSEFLPACAADADRFNSLLLISLFRSLSSSLDHDL